ncbi:hypothetical protein BJV78DRAFT_1251400 [Lactifluus subvellereus]|nr:hypothetical protein BJV78DRAFT_1251400 [Lactifluus subvellereus]
MSPRVYLQVLVASLLRGGPGDTRSSVIPSTLLALSDLVSSHLNTLIITLPHEFDNIYNNLPQLPTHHRCRLRQLQRADRN